ncbi:F-box-like domain protein [Rhizoctonia solani]|uniref:F-box-like domain protein n=1 Tax=Rhizoctonia solani TaxID=456999 RepID=A0A8H8P5C8_9AGAM|nr:F-box-like domain protein [Rhizoctonia solani]QRW25540.1 F-box-like domain protein [Rhizoctonia solani]
MANGSQFKGFIELVDAIHVQAELARYLAISGIALLIYDWLSTLDKEVEYTWSRKWTFARIVYHLNRVLPVLLIGTILIPNVLFAPAHFTASICFTHNETKESKVCYRFIICTTSIIRCWALYGRRLLIPGLVVTVGHATFHVTINIEKISVFTNPLPDILQGCLVTVPNDIWLAYFSGVLYELVVFCMIVWKVWDLGRGLGLTPLMKQLLKHGASFFAVNLGVMLFSCVGSAYPSTIIAANGSGLLTALSSIMCSRIFFSMHDFASEDRVHISIGPPLSSGRGSGIISGQFAIPMQTMTNGSEVPSGLRISFTAPSQTTGPSISKAKGMRNGSDHLSV